jgi:hypothetical protein
MTWMVECVFNVLPLLKWKVCYELSQFSIHVFRRRWRICVSDENARTHRTEYIWFVFPFSTVVPCGEADYTPATQICCCGKVHNKIANRECCGRKPYDSSKQKCCLNYNIRNINAPCPGEDVSVWRDDLGIFLLNWMIENV